MIFVQDVCKKSQCQNVTFRTRHRASTSMYSLTFRVHVTTPPQYGRNGTAHAAGASILSPARGVFAGMRSVRVRHACDVRWAWWITAGLCHAFLYCCHRNATRAPIANPPNSAQLGGSLYNYSSQQSVVWHAWECPFP